MSSAPPELAERLLGAPVVGAEQIHGGRNSQVFRVETAAGGRYALKRYFRHDADPRDRLGVEFASLTFLRSRGVERVPEPIAQDPEAGAALYEYVEGERVAGAAGAGDVDDAVEFVRMLAALRTDPAADSLPFASEACVAPAAILDVIERRRARLADSGALEGFLADELAPVLDRVAARAEVPSGTLPRSEQTLSPSDFGFHNAIRRPDSSLVYVDFEYFGWDDPAKLVCDFLLHPGMALDERLKARFVAGIDAVFGGSPALAARIETLYPLHGLKWVLILLNDFVPQDRERRRFAGTGADTLRGQLAKARTLLRKIDRQHGSFPYRP